MCKLLRLLIPFGLLIYSLSACTSTRNPSAQPREETAPKEDEITAQYSYNAYEEYKPEDGDLVVYYLDKTEFPAFLVEPSMSFFEENNSGFLVFRESPIKHHPEEYGYAEQGYVEMVDYARGGVKDEQPSGYYRVGSFPISLEFADYMNQMENLDEILLQQKIEETVLDYAIIEYPFSNRETTDTPAPGTMDSTMCIWFHTASGDYFLEHNAYLTEPRLPGDFTYSFYNLQTYSPRKENSRWD
jgi:hypothetical protein